MLTDAQRRAQKRYMKTRTRQIAFRLNIGTDADILAHIDKQPSKQGYLKQLVRADIAKQAAAQQ